MIYQCPKIKNSRTRSKTKLVLKFFFISYLGRILYIYLMIQKKNMRSFMLVTLHQKDGKTYMLFFTLLIDFEIKLQIASQSMMPKLIFGLQKNRVRLENMMKRKKKHHLERHVEDPTLERWEDLTIFMNYMNNISYVFKGGLNQLSLVS